MSNLNSNEVFGCRRVHPDIKCKTCRYANGTPPFADLPTKSYCKIYDRESGMRKPPEVYYEGKDCEHYKAL